MDEFGYFFLKWRFVLVGIKCGNLGLLGRGFYRKVNIFMKIYLFIFRYFFNVDFIILELGFRYDLI